MYESGRHSNPRATGSLTYTHHCIREQYQFSGQSAVGEKKIKELVAELMCTLSSHVPKEREYTHHCQNWLTQLQMDKCLAPYYAQPACTMTSTQWHCWQALWGHCLYTAQKVPVVLVSSRPPMEQVILGG